LLAKPEGLILAIIFEGDCSNLSELSIVQQSFIGFAKSRASALPQEESSKIVFASYVSRQRSVRLSNYRHKKTGLSRFLLKH